MYQYHPSRQRICLILCEIRPKRSWSIWMILLYLEIGCDTTGTQGIECRGSNASATFFMEVIFMACNSYQTYSTNSGCGSCGGSTYWNNDIYFPDFVANSCCNPVCDPWEDDHEEGCNICNGGGYGTNRCGCSCHNHDWEPYQYPSCPWYGCGCCRQCPWYRGGCGCNHGCCCNHGCGCSNGCSCHDGDIQPR